MIIVILSYKWPFPTHLHNQVEYEEWNNGGEEQWRAHANNDWHGDHAEETRDPHLEIVSDCNIDGINIFAKPVHDAPNGSCIKKGHRWASNVAQYCSMQRPSSMDIANI